MRSYLIALVIAVCVPFIAFQGYYIARESRELHQQAAAVSYHAARATAGEVAQFVRSTDRALAFLANRPQVRALDPANCDPMIKILQAARDRIANVLTVDLEGRLICSAAGVDPARPQQVDPKYWLARLRETGQPVIGTPARGFVTGLWVVTMAYPVRDDSGKMAGAAAMSIDLARFQFSKEGLQAPEGTTIAILNGEGVVIARSADAEIWLGKNAADHATVRAALAQRSGTLRSAGLDGVERDLGFTPVAGTDWVVVAGIPAEVAKAQVASSVIGSILAAAAALVFALLLAWRIARRVSVPVKEMAAAAGRVAAGDNSARAPVAGPSEIIEVADRFNRMLEAQRSQQQALRESEEKLRLFVEHAPTAIAMFDREMRYVAFSRRWLADYHLGDQDLTGRSHYHVFPDLPERWKEIHRRCLAGAVEKAEDESFPRDDGSVEWVRWEVRPWHAGDGRVGGIIIFSEVITERKRAEVALRESEDRYRQIIQTSMDGFWIVDAGGRIREVNAAYCELSGYTREELLDMRVPDVEAEETPEQTAEHMREIMTIGHARFETRHRSKDGKLRNIEVQTVYHADIEDGRFFIFLHDITERKQAEQKIRAQLEHLGLLDQITRSTGERLDLKSIFQIVLIRLEDSLPVDFGCVCLYDAAANTLRVTNVGAKSEALAHELMMDERATIAIDENGLSRCIQGRLVYEPDVSKVRFPFPERLSRGGLGSLVMAPLRSESRVFGVVVVARRAVQAFSSTECEFLRQLSEHVALAAHQAQLYGSLQQAYDDLRQTQAAVMQEERLRALGQMASGIAHDINNALSPVSLYVESMLETERTLSERARGYLQTIQRAVEDVAQTVARLREFYRRREQQLELAPVQMNAMVQQVVDLTRARWRDMPQSRGIVIRALTELAPDLPNVMGVESEIREALTNLVFNAVDAMPGGGALTLRTLRVDADAEHPAVAVEVVDTGAGMDEDTRKRCLEPFFTTKGDRGTGLGLAMVFGMVQRHSAEIEIDSAPGAGTTVRLVFAVPTAVQTESGQPVTAPQVPAGLRLLLIDDDPMLIKSLQDTLETDGHVIVTANGGEAGIAAFRASLGRGEPYAAVITDLGMPYVDGRRVAAAVKETSPTTPVILLTGWGQRLVAEGDIPAHVDRVLAKPPRLREVREALAQLCATQHTDSPPSATM